MFKLKELVIEVEIFSRKNYIVNHPVVFEQTSQMNTFLAISIFIVQGVKYPSHYAEKFFQAIINVLPATNFDNFKIYDLLFGYNYFSRCI